MINHHFHVVRYHNRPVSNATGFRMLFSPIFFAVLLSLLLWTVVVIPAVSAVNRALSQVRAPMISINPCTPTNN